MSDKVRMVYENVGSVANTFQENGTRIEELISALDSSVSTIQETWKGQAYGQFTQEWAQLKPDLQAFAKTAHLAASNLRTATQKFQEADSSASSLFKA